MKDIGDKYNDAIQQSVDRRSAGAATPSGAVTPSSATPATATKKAVCRGTKTAEKAAAVATGATVEEEADEATKEGVLSRRAGLASVSSCGTGLDHWVVKYEVVTRKTLSNVFQNKTKFERDSAESELQTKH